MKLLQKNRKALYEYTPLYTLVAGIKLVGSEIKSIREGDVNIKNTHCVFRDGEIYVRGMHIGVYKQSGTHHNHEPLRERKLLLNKSEIQKLFKEIGTMGVTIIPTALLINKGGKVKLEIALAKGKKIHDKRADIKKRDIERDTQRKFK